MSDAFEPPGVFIEELPEGTSLIPGADRATTAFVGGADDGPLDTPVVVDSAESFTRTFGASPDAPLTDAVLHFFLNGGRSAVVVRSPDALRGLAALETARFGLLCVPPPSHDRDLDAATRAAAASLCAGRRAILIADPLRAWTTPEQVVAGVADDAVWGIAGCPDAALYFPFLQVESLARAPCGAVAGAIARIEAARGVWSPPAGVATELAGVTGFSAPIDEDAAARLASAGVNGLRDMPGIGPLIWGARTLAGADARPSEWQYVAVRRLALFIEQSIAEGTPEVVFEPNDEPLWASLRASIDNFLESLFAQGAFAGETPDDAWFVRCDRTTMTQDDLDNGRLIAVVGVAPVKPAEFVILRLGQWTASHPR